MVDAVNDDAGHDRLTGEQSEAPAPAAAVMDTDAEPVPGRKRSRTDNDSEETKRRSQRMLGVMLGTLSSFRKASEHKTDAAKQREAIDAKLQERLAKEKEESAERQRVETEERRKRREERVQLMADMHQRAANKAQLRRQFYMAHFLCTASTTSGKSLYYRPVTLTDAQTALIDKQVEEATQRVRDELPDLLDELLATENAHGEDIGTLKSHRLDTDHDEAMLAMEAEMQAEDEEKGNVNDTVSADQMDMEVDPETAQEKASKNPTS